MVITEGGNDVSWLDYVPGARQAFDYITLQLSRLNVVGLQDVPRWRSIADQTAGYVAGDAVLANLHRDVVSNTGALARAYSLIKGQWDGVQMELNAWGLGSVPVSLLIKVGGAVVAISGAVYLFLRDADKQRQRVAVFVDAMVKAGKLTAEQGAKLLRDAPGVVSNLGDVFTKVVLIGGGFYLIGKVLSKRGIV